MQGTGRPVPGQRLLPAADVVYSAGGRLVVLRSDSKVPAWRGWLRNRRPRPATVVSALEVGCGLGVVPGTLSSVVLDHDHGDPAELFHAAGDGWLHLPTPRGSHRYYDACGITRRPFEAHGCRGDLVEKKGYVCLHGDGLLQLADALPQRTPAPLQTDLFGPAPEKPPSRRGRDADQRTVTALVPPQTILEEVPRGARWPALWDAVRFWAYPQQMGEDRDSWSRRVLLWAVSQNERFPWPMWSHSADDRKDQTAVRYISALVAGWCWDNLRDFRGYDHSSLAQRRRQVKRWHGDAREDTLAALENRDRCMVELALDGCSLREIATRYQLRDQMNVRAILRREGLAYSREHRAWEWKL